MNLSEKDYTELYKYSLSAASRYVGYGDSAFDVAQNVILSFLSNKTQISNPRSWIKVVVRREAAKYTSDQITQREIGKSVKVETLPKTETEEDTDKVFALDSKHVRELLSIADYSIYVRLRNHKFSVQTYSIQENVSYNTAKNHRLRIKCNILAALLWEDGWRTGNKILNHTQYYNIQRFVNTLVESAKDQRLRDMKFYTSKIDPQELSSILAPVVECFEWSVSFSKGLYNLTLVCLKEDSEPHFIIATLDFTKKNVINLKSIYVPESSCIGYGDISVFNPYEVKGMIDLTRAEMDQMYERHFSPTPV